MWTAFGIMLGLVADLALHSVPDSPNIHGLNWRLMLGSVCILTSWDSYVFVRWLTCGVDPGRLACGVCRGPGLLLPRICEFEIFLIYVNIT